MKNCRFALLLTAALAVFCCGAFAQTPVSVSPTLTWKAPTTRENGDALTAAEIAGYTLYYGQTAVSLDSGGYIQLPVASTIATVGNIAGSSLTQKVTFSLTPRAQPYTIFYALTVTDIFGLTSKPGLLTTTITVKPGSNPSAPSTLNATIVCTGGGGQCVLTIVQ